MLFIVRWYDETAHYCSTGSGETVYQLYSKFKHMKFHVYTGDGIELDPERGLEMKKL